MSYSLFFLHGLDSSSKGTKGQYFSKNFPAMIIPDFTGDLQERLHALDSLCKGYHNLLLVGSSFGGLMATCFAIAHPDRVKRLILLAPALNFHEFSPPIDKIRTPSQLFIGKFDAITPPDLVIPAAHATFLDLSITISNDDHFLKTTFFNLDWPALLS
jgi:pimeloyl-ACP methyl ester carboxylesterase